MVNSTIINVDSALEQLGDMDFYLELVDELISAFPEKKQQLAKALLENNENELILISHSIKGVSANLHLPQVRAFAADLEKAVKESDNQNYKSLIDKLFIAFDSLVQERKLIT